MAAHIWSTMTTDLFCADSETILFLHSHFLKTAKKKLRGLGITATICLLHNSTFSHRYKKRSNKNKNRQKH